MYNKHLNEGINKYVWRFGNKYVPVIVIKHNESIELVDALYTTKISVIIPYKNNWDLLRVAVESVPNRDDIEIVVVDDKSEKRLVFEEHDFQVIYAAPPEKIASIGQFITTTVSLSR